MAKETNKMTRVEQRICHYYDQRKKFEIDLRECDLKKHEDQSADHKGRTEWASAAGQTDAGANHSPAP